MTDTPDQSRSAWLSRVAFALALMIVVARCLMIETMREMDLTPNAPRGPGATTALVLDWLSGVPAMLVLMRRLLDRSFTLRWSWSHASLTLLGLWALASTVWADDQFLSLVTSTRLIAAGMLFWTFAQVVRRWDQFRIVAGVLVGLLLANVAQGILYRTLDLADLNTYWQQNKAQIIHDHGWQPGDYFATRFEQKLLAGEVMGFNASPNTLGAIVVMMSLVALGAAAQRVEDRDEPGWAGMLFIAAASSLYLLYYAKSNGSNQAFVLGIGALVLWRLTRKRLADYRTILFAVGCGLALLAVVGVLGLGLSRGGLPQDSLNFRWRYWVGSWPIVAEHPLTGVGWSNFANAYLAHRVAPATEEINDPHNFMVKLATELGIVGLALGLAWLLKGAWRATQLVGPEDGDRPAPLGGLIATCAGALILSCACAVDFASADASYLSLEVLKRCLLIGLIALGVGVVAIKSSKTPVLDGRPAKWMAAALFVGLGTFVLQSTIDIAFFQTGPLMLFVMGLGALLGIAAPTQPPRRDSLTVIGLIAGCVFGAILLVTLVIPVGLAESAAQRAKEAASQQRPDLAARYFGEAFDAWLPVKNADYALAAAQQSIQIDDGRGLPRAFEWLDRAVQANPNLPMALLTRARLRAKLNPDPAAVEQILADFGKAVANNPNDVELRIEYADLFEHFGKRADAARELSKALEINDQFDPKEPERIELQSPGRLEVLRTRLARLQE